MSAIRMLSSGTLLRAARRQVAAGLHITLRSPHPHPSACVERVRGTVPLHQRSGHLLEATDWLREFVYFKDMARKDHYAKQRLGYAASNIFVLSLSQY